MSHEFDKKKFGGKYVATKDFASNKVIASGKNAEKVYNKAVEQGIQEPVINYVHKEGAVFLY